MTEASHISESETNENIYCSEVSLDFLLVLKFARKKFKRTQENITLGWYLLGHLIHFLIKIDNAMWANTDDRVGNTHNFRVKVKCVLSLERTAYFSDLNFLGAFECKCIIEQTIKVTG